MEKEIWQKILHAAQVEALLLVDPANMRHIAGFAGEGYVYLSRGRQVVVTDSRYTLAAGRECPDFEIRDWHGGQYYDVLAELLGEEGVGRFGIEDEYMTVADYARLEKALSEAGVSAESEPLGKQVTELRAVKSPEEIEKIRRAEAIGDRAFARLLPELRTCMTEKQVAARLEFYMKEEGAEGFSFDTIAASGIHSAMPHAVPTDKKIEKGDFLTLDFGCRYQGYCSDMTRTVVFGRADERQREIYETVLRAQKKALEAIRPGLTGKEIDAVARDVIKEAGYGDCFGHSLGHSVGLEIHETPCFSTKEEQVIRPGMVITVEPGIYVADFGGVRIEDVVAITEDGCENLTHSPKELIEIEIN